MKAVSKRFSDKPTALGGTTSSSVSGSFYAGVGVNDESGWKSNTAGGSYSYSSDTSKGLSALVDLNGDGLPDKVYKSGGTVYYRPQIKTDNGEVVYGEPIKVKGISSFSTSKSSTNSFGANAVVGWNSLTAVVGTNKSTTKTKTTQYFSDQMDVLRFQEQAGESEQGSASDADACSRAVQHGYVNAGWPNFYRG